MKTYLGFWLDCFKALLKGSTLYWLWIASLLIAIFCGVLAYGIQFHEGLSATSLSDQISWGCYIANFTFLVGVAAAAVLLVYPSYINHREDFKEIVIFGELLAVAAIIMSLLFVMVDLGRPDRFLHILPFIGRLNFPQSILAWDVVVLNGYLILNLHITGYILYARYRGLRPKRRYYLPWVFISIGWAISIHTVTAFLYSGLGSRPFWNSSILAARFLISAFAAGPCILLLIFTLIRAQSKLEIKDSVFSGLKAILQVTLPINMFLFGCELFKEFYTDSSHSISVEYLFFGIHGHGLLMPYIWAALAFNSFAVVVFSSPSLRRHNGLSLTAAFLCIIGIWIEKGMGLVIPGMFPSPLGDLVEYAPSAVEFFVSMGIWAIGVLIYTLCVKAAIQIETGQLQAKRFESPT